MFFLRLLLFPIRSPGLIYCCTFVSNERKRTKIVDLLPLFCTTNTFLRFKNKKLEFYLVVVVYCIKKPMK